MKGVVELPKRRHADPKMPSETQYDELLKRVEGTRYHALICLAGDSGLRRGELLALRWCDINFSTAEIVISRALSETPDSGMEIKSTKSGKTRRHTLSQHTLDALRKHRTLIEADMQMFGDDYQRHDLVFCTPLGEFYSLKQITNRVAEYWRSIGVRSSIHQIRHYAASFYISRGVPVTTVSERLGHADAAITLRVYARSLPGDDRRAADVWDQVREEKRDKAKKPAKIAQFPKALVIPNVIPSGKTTPKLLKIKR
jgi:integrase